MTSQTKNLKTMEITVTEALRIKNEISAAVDKLKYNINNASFGVTTEDGEVISDEKEKFGEVEEKLIKALTLSEEINSVIAAFNQSSEVPNTVRKMQNAKLLMEVYSRNLQKTKPNKSKRFENLSTVRKSIETVYTPSVSGKELKNRISSQKTLVRNFQSKIEQANQLTVKVSFEYADVENLID